MKITPETPKYFDNNATTRIDDAVLAAMLPYLSSDYANPSGVYAPSRRAALALAEARHRVARLIGARDDEIVFTSGGTEANATALESALRARPARAHVVASAVEHASLREPLRRLEQRGGSVTWIPVSRDGELDLAALDRAVGPDTALVTVMVANNETGALLPVEQAARLARSRGVLFHTDAVQVAGKLPFNVGELAIDTASLCAHKMHGPKGVGALYVRQGTPFDALVVGGGQEGGRRAGTENVPALVGFGAAAERARETLPAAAAAVRELRDAFERGLLRAIPEAHVVAGRSARLPNTSLVLIPGADTEALLALLDMAGLCCSSGSACASGSHEPSHVLQAMGLGSDRSFAVLRVSLSRYNDLNEIDYLVRQVQTSLASLRAQRGPAPREGNFSH